MSNPMLGMREALRSSLGRSLETLPELDRLAAAWPVAAGVALASRAEVLAYENGELTLRVADEEWVEPIAHMRLVLQSDLSRIAGVRVSAIHLDIRR